MNDNLEKNINRYLNNEMPESERIAFEAQMRQDKALADEVEFQRGFVGFLGRHKPELEAKLDALGDTYILESAKKKSYNWWILLGLLLVVAIISYFILSSRNSNQNTNNTSKPTIETPEEIAPESTSIEEDTTKNIEADKPIIIPPTIEETQPVEDNPPIEDQPIASIDESLYERNPNMELVIQTNVRATAQNQLVTIEIPIDNATLNTENQPLFSIKGTATTPLNYKIIIYNNQDFAINNNLPVFETTAQTIEKNGKNLIQFNANIPFDKGLHYLIIQKEGARDILHISRFEVR